jgi:hypothetical protein
MSPRARVLEMVCVSGRGLISPFLSHTSWRKKVLSKRKSASISIFAIFRLKDISDAAYMNEEEY